MSDADALLWLDLETTGDDFHEDEIIEIGAAVTDHQFNILHDVYSKTVKPSSYAFERLMDNEEVRQMHVNNGLIKSVFRATDEIEEADREITSWLRENYVRFSIVSFQMAGSGVALFDRPFVRKWMPHLEEMLIRPVLDVGHVRRFLSMINVLSPEDKKTMESFKENKTHRAIADVYTHIHEAEMYRRIIKENPALMG